MSYHEKIMELAFVKVQELPVHDTKKWAKRDPNELKGVVVHQSLEEYGTAKGNARYHVGPNHISSDGLPGLSYTFFIEKSGEVIYTNPIECKTYSQGYAARPGDENAEFVSICVGGNFSGPGYKGTQDPTVEQMIAVSKLWIVLRDMWGWSDDALHGHYEFGKQACPGYSLMKIIEGFGLSSFSTTIERQKALAALGHYRGDLDGKWGPESKAALVKFQGQAGLELDGVWSSETTEKVKAALAGTE